jgi:hypothetical protein
LDVLSKLDTSKYGVSVVGTMGLKVMRPCSPQIRADRGDVDLCREDRVPRLGASVRFVQAAAVRAASQTARFMS